MRGVRISYLIDHPEYIPQLAQWLFEEWGAILDEKTVETRIKKLQAHLNRDELPIAWVAHANGQLLGTAALSVHDLDGRENLTPWLGGVFMGAQFRRRGIGTALCATVEDAARLRRIHSLYLFTLDKKAWYSCLGWKSLGPCVWHQRTGDIMCKQLQTFPRNAAADPVLLLMPIGFMLTLDLKVLSGRADSAVSRQGDQ